MMLPGYALAAQGTQIHVATWPLGIAYGAGGHLLSQAFAQQANCYLIAVGAAWTEEATPEVLKGLEPPESFLDGPGSGIIHPEGKILEQLPSPDEEAIITAEGSLGEVLSAKEFGDIGGHYSRPDVLQLHINRRPLRRFVEAGSGDWSAAAGELQGVRPDSAGDHQDTGEKAD
jgi:nitrilase